MNLVIDFAGTLVLVPAAEAAPIVTALAHAQVVEREGWEAHAPYRLKRDSRISIAVVHPDQLQAPTPQVEELQKDVQRYTRHWLNSDAEHRKTKEQLKAMKDRLAQAGIKFEEPASAPTEEIA